MATWRFHIPRRSLPALAGGGGAAPVVVVVIWVLPSVLTEHPHIPKSADRHKAITDTRTGLIALIVAIGAAGGLIFTVRTYLLSRQGQVTDTYTRAIEQLGHEH